MNILKYIFSIKYLGERRTIKLLGIKLPVIRKRFVFSKIKNSDVKIAFYVGCDDGKSSRYRVDNIVEALTKKNIIADCYYKRGIGKLYKNIQNYDLLVVFRAGEFDKRYIEKIINVYSKCRENNIPIIYDIDDFLCNSKSEVITKNVSYLVSDADALTVTTSYLAKCYKNLNENVFVIKNTINYEQYNIAQNINKEIQKNDTVKIVYQCGSQWHDNDFAICSSAILKILEKYKNTEFHLMGPVKFDSEFLKFGKRFVRPKYMNFKELLKYTSEMDINIAPLEINNFNNCKSELKIFESALVKIPTICSPINSYKDLINHGHNGFLADSEDEWVKYLSELTENKNLRIKIGETAYKDFVQKFYIENEINNVISIYNKLLKSHKGKQI
ncbi:glycosyltransferase [bacterium]|nr:glycosyltransferase [bacterium]